LRSQPVDSWENLAANLSTLCPFTKGHSKISIGAGAKTIQLVRLEFSEPAFDDMSFISIRLPLVRQSQLDPVFALTLNAEMAVGTIRLREGVYELNHVVDLRSLVWGQLDKLLGYLGQLGAALRADILLPQRSESSLAGALECFDFCAE